MHRNHAYKNEPVVAHLPAAREAEALRQANGGSSGLLERLARLERTNQELGAANRRLQLDVQRLERLVYLDPLTGLGNRRQFDTVLDAEIRRAARTSQPLTLLLCDVDYFKQYNDAYGHGLGDAVLVRVGKALARACRRGGERAARIGGEEFALVFPNVDAVEADAVAENVRKRVSDLRIRHNHSSVADRITISIGATTFRSAAPCQPVRLLEIADAALYEAKRSGRNCSKFQTVPQICDRSAGLDLAALELEV
jgi:diguanylate cyclase (GGDEF)-like protein